MPDYALNGRCVVNFVNQTNKSFARGSLRGCHSHAMFPLRWHDLLQIEPNRRYFNLIIIANNSPSQAVQSVKVVICCTHVG